MIYKVDEEYVISSRGTWIVGVYKDERTAKYAFRFSENELYNLWEKACPNPITFEQLQQLFKKRNEIQLKKSN